MNDVKIGGVGIWLDEIVPCLKDTETGEIKETVVFKIESRSFLKKFNEKNGWGINWIDMLPIFTGHVRLPITTNF